MKQKPYGFYEAARPRHEAKRTFFIFRVAKQRFIAEGCFIFHAPQVRFISKTKSTSYEVLFVLARVDKKDALFNSLNI